ncbi:hypothetical protein [Aquimarina agarivorans]|uniref:hypothetical protein n=1 Tax=Aquimarina agarivorans TaxID=980584 RepID=UPI000248FC5A|nr:hypothetical protein [Aquimarina agarivorans]
MNRKQTIQTGLIAGLIIGVGLLQYRLYKMGKSKNNDFASDQTFANLEIAPTTTSTTKASEKKATPKPVANPIKKVTTPDLSKAPKQKKEPLFPLKLGSKGNEVTQIQMYLLKNHGWEKVTMGTFDAATQKRVQQFLKVKEVPQSLYKKLIKKPVQLQ